jgi:hypothetical protein
MTNRLCLLLWLAVLVLLDFMNVIILSTVLQMRGIHLVDITLADLNKIFWSQVGGQGGATPTYRSSQQRAWTPTHRFTMSAADRIEVRTVKYLRQ